MTKQEIIQEAYGEHWDEVKELIDENGWDTVVKYSINYKTQDYKIRGHGMYITRPISLFGIENNNGWINIENQSDLPSTYTECHFELKNKDIQIGAYVNHKNIFVGIDEQFIPSEITSYKPIANPQLRIY
ncbi:MAG: hypothetical protein V4683_11990 [Bacteroidota bacterium]